MTIPPWERRPPAVEPPVSRLKIEDQYKKAVFKFLGKVDLMYMAQ